MVRIPNKLRVSLLGLLLISLWMSVGLHSEPEVDYVRTELQRLINQHKIRTAIVMYVDDDATGLLRLGEISDERREPPNESSTIFEIGSITKVFTALLVQTLVAEDDLDWDDPISKHLRGIKFANDGVATITLRELATHRSGLPRLPSNFSATEEPGDPMDPYATYAEQNLVSFLESFDPVELAKSYAYSNLGFAILGYVVSETLDTNYADAIHKRILQPLGMNDTTATDELSEEAELAAGYSNTANMGLWNFNVHASAGSIRSTALDMYKFMLANFADSDNELHQSMRAIRELQYDSNQALGWTTETSDADTTVFVHGGQTGGYASFLAIDPANKRGWVILTTSNEAESIAKLGSSFYKDISVPNTIDLAPYSGVYQLSEQQYMTVSDHDGTLQAQISGQPPFVLQYANGHIFQLEVLNLSAEFTIDEDGKANKMIWKQPGVSIDAERVDASHGIKEREEVPVESDVLQKFVGLYQLAPTATVTVKQITDRLFVQVTGQPEFRVFPMSGTRFFYKAIDAEIEFEENEDGLVTGLVIHQMGANRAPKINNED